MSKSPSRGPEYSREREFKVILEHIESQFQTFGEGLSDVRERVIHLEEDISQIKQDVQVMKSAFPRFAIQVSDHEKRITILEHNQKIS